MQNEGAFRQFLKKRGRSRRAVDEIVGMVVAFADFLHDQYQRYLDDATPQDLGAFVAWIGAASTPTDKKYCWALAYYYQYIDRPDMVEVAQMLRAEKSKRRTLRLKEFRDIDEADLEALAVLNIKYAEQLLEAGRDPECRRQLSQQSGVALDVIEYAVRLADLARIHGVRGIRASLYIGAGLDTLDKLGAVGAEELRDITRRWIKGSGFNGVPPTPKEAAVTVEEAAKLPRLVEY